LYLKIILIILISDADFFSSLVVDAILAVKSTSILGENKYPVKAVNVVKSHGKSTVES
jgi:T-complex protein 1 subunit alpha